MRLCILSFGKLDKSFFQEAAKEYQKRLQRFCNLEILELKEEFAFEPSKNKFKNSQVLLSKLKNFQDYEIYLLDIHGLQTSSEAFAQILLTNKNRKMGKICFVIGPSDGYDSELMKEFPKISFGLITLPHQLFRVVLLEQIYRGFKINNQEKYHK